MARGKKGVWAPVPLCKCGCGRPIRVRVGARGQMLGYSGKYAPDCPLRPAPGAPLPKEIRNKDRRPRTGLPVGSISISNVSKTRTVAYRHVKVADGIWVSEHRLVAERKIGRPLFPNEDVHHIDGNGLNNDPANLVVLTKSMHKRLHCAAPKSASGASSPSPSGAEKTPDQHPR